MFVVFINFLLEKKNRGTDESKKKIFFWRRENNFIHKFVLLFSLFVINQISVIDQDFSTKKFTWFSSQLIPKSLGDVHGRTGIGWKEVVARAGRRIPPPVKKDVAVTEVLILWRTSQHRLVIVVVPLTRLHVPRVRRIMSWRRT